MAPNTQCGLFPIRLLCINTYTTQELKVVFGRSNYRTNALIPKVSIFWVRALYKIQLVTCRSNKHRNHLSIRQFVHNCKLITRKLQVVYGLSTYWTTALLSKVTFSVLQLDVRHDWWVMGSGMHHSVFPIYHLCIVIHIFLQNIHGRSAYWTTAPIRDIPWVVQSSMKDPTGELQPQTCISLPLIQHCVRMYTASLHLLY